MLPFEFLFEKLALSLETGERVFSEKEMLQLSKSRDCLIRSLAAEALVNYPFSFAQSLLRELLQDKNANVRSSAAIAFTEISAALDGTIMNEIQNAFLYDKDYLTRGYAGYALLKHGADRKEVVSVVETAITKERNLFVQATVYSGFYTFCARLDALNDIIQCFRSKNYRTRCAVVNILIEILDIDNAFFLSNVVERFLEREDSTAVKESLVILKKKIEGM